MPGREVRWALLLALTLSLGALPAAAEAQTCSGYVGITFDDGPSSSTSSLLNALRSAGLTPVTFFNTGQNVAGNPSLVAQQATLGSVQNHSYTHGHMTSMSQATMQSELSRTNQVISSNGGGTPRLFRPPYGETNSTLQSVASGLGLRVITWDVDSQDWNNASTSSIVSAVGRLQNGQVILLHEWPANTIAAIPQIASNLRSRGLCPGVIDPSSGRAVAPGGGTTYALTVTRSGTGSGTVTSSTGGINCGTACAATLASGTTVTLTATPASGSTFGGWSGACAGTGSCVVTMTAARAVTATFNGGTGTTYALTVTKAGTGSGTVTSSTGGINCGATCSANLTSGTTVTLTATAASGSTFGGWSGACAGTGSCVVTMTAARSVTATFDGGTPSGEVVSINAGGAATGSFLADGSFSGGSTYSTTTAIDTSLLSGTVPPQAVFQTERYGEFTYTIAGRAAGSAQTVTLYFAESYWSAAGQRTFNVAVNGQSVLTAFDIYAAAGARNRAVARSFSTTASASGQVVIAFTRGGGPDNPKISGITVAAGGGTDPDPDPTTYALTVARSGNGTVSGGGISCGAACSATYESGTAVTLTATPDANATFTGWGGACSGTSATCVVTMSAAQAVTATFTTGGTDPGTCRTATGGQSGNFNTTDAVCYVVSTTINGWGCSNATGRTVTVNGTAVTCGQLPLPGGAPYTFSFSAGSYPWASFYWW